MIIDLESMSPSRVYHAMIQTIIPRPIAWVLSDNGNGLLNLAPFSYFNGVCSSPPIVSISVGRRADGTPKDTWRNIAERDHFVVHSTPSGLAEPMVASSESLPPGESEVSSLGLPTIDVPGQPLPRLADVPVAMFCTRYAIHEVGDGPQGLILGQVTHMFVDDAAVSTDDDGRLHIDPVSLDPIARLGGRDYMKRGEIQTIGRPG